MKTVEFIELCQKLKQPQLWYALNLLLAKCIEVLLLLRFFFFLGYKKVDYITVFDSTQFVINFGFYRFKLELCTRFGFWIAVVDFCSLSNRNQMEELFFSSRFLLIFTDSCFRCFSPPIELNNFSRNYLDSKWNKTFRLSNKIFLRLNPYFQINHD